VKDWNFVARAPLRTTSQICSRQVRWVGAFCRRLVMYDLSLYRSDGNEASAAKFHRVEIDLPQIRHTIPMWGANEQPPQAPAHEFARTNPNHRTCPVPTISYLVEVNSASANGPRA